MSVASDDLAVVVGAASTGSDDVLAAAVEASLAAAPVELGAADEHHRRVRRALVDAGRFGPIPDLDYRHARVLVQLGDLEGAIERIDAAAAGFRSAGRSFDALRTGLGRIHALGDCGRHREGIETGQAALAEITRLIDTGALDPDDESVQRTRAAFDENTATALGYLGRHAEASTRLEAASEAYGRLGLDDDANRAQAILGIELMNAGRLAEADRTLLVVQSRFDARGDAFEVAKCQSRRGTIALRAGRWDDALSLLQKAATTMTRLDAGPERVRALAARAFVHLSLGLVEEAIAGYTVVAESSGTMGLDTELAHASFGLGIALGRQQRRDEGSRALGRAIALFESVGDQPMVARCLLALSDVDDDPIEHALAALDLLDPEERPADAAFAHLRVAGLGHDVESHLRAAEDLAAPLGSPHLDWRVAFALASHAHDQGRSADAFAHAQVAVDIVDGIRSSAPSELLRDSIAGDRRAPAVLLATLCEQLGDFARAAEIADQARPLHRHAPPMPRTTRPHRLDDLYTDLLRLPAMATEQVREEIRGLEQRDASATDVGTGSDQTVVVFQRSLEGFVGLLRRAGTWSRFALTATDGDVDRAVGDLAAHWRRMVVPGLADRHGDELQLLSVEAIRQVEKLLWAPIADRLAQAEPVVVVADGILAGVPFHAFAANRDRVLSVAPSVGLADSLAHRRPASGVVVFGVPDMQAPAVGEEARRVAAVHDGAVLRIGNDASHEALVAALPSAGIVHLAAHGLHRPDNPRYSAIRLGDLWLTATRAEALRLDGQIVILSACDVGIDAVAHEASPIGGLPRAFLAAGASAVIAAAWPVDDQITLEFMVHLHEALRAGESSAEAVRRARSMVALRHPHPFHWAAFHHVGAGQPEGA